MDEWAASEALRQYFEALLGRFGPQGWWPARSRLEVILGAILTQNTAWENAARAIAALRRAGLLRLDRLKAVARRELEGCIRPAGFFRQKSRAIRHFLEWLFEVHGGSLSAVFSGSPLKLRAELLELDGVGPETADAILLYAGNQPFFVADAYTRRVLARHGWISPEADYTEAQAFLHGHLPRQAPLYNEFHALLVEAGKRYCRRPAPRCKGCPLEDFLPRDRPLVISRSSA